MTTQHDKPKRRQTLSDYSVVAGVAALLVGMFVSFTELYASTELAPWHILAVGLFWSYVTLSAIFLPLILCACLRR